MTEPLLGLAAGLAASALSLGLYAILSDQPRIAHLKDELGRARAQAMDDNVPAGRAVSDTLRAAMRLAGASLGPLLLAMVPTLGAVAFLALRGGSGAGASGGLLWSWEGGFMAASLAVWLILRPILRIG